MARPRRKRPRPLRQIALFEGPRTAVAGRGDLLPTSVLLRHRSCERALETIRNVRAFFPELDGVLLKVGLTRRAAGLAAREEPWIWVNPRRLTRHTVAHEIVHLMQARGLAPAGEKSADLYALARHPVLADDLPFYLETPRSFREAFRAGMEPLGLMLHSVAAESLRQREAGRRRYLRWFELELDRRWVARSEAMAAGAEPRPPLQASLF